MIDPIQEYLMLFVQADYTLARAADRLCRVFLLPERDIARCFKASPEELREWAGKFPMFKEVLERRIEIYRAARTSEERRLDRRNRRFPRHGYQH